MASDRLVEREEGDAQVRAVSVLVVREPERCIAEVWRVRQDEVRLCICVLCQCGRPGF